MNKHMKEVVLIFFQIIVFYVIPFIGLQIDPMGLMIMLLVLTFIISIFFGSLSSENFKYLFPIFNGILFLPSVYLFYNESALIYALLHFISSLIGLFIGINLYKIRE